LKNHIIIPDLQLALVLQGGVARCLWGRHT